MSTIRKPIIRMANNPRLLLVGVVLTWLVAATLFALVEQTSLVDGLYWSMTTMSTVGYGDLSPATTLGKFITIAVQAWSIFVLVPSAVANIIDSVRIDEAKFTHAEQEWQEHAIKEIAKANGVTLPESPSDY